MSDRRLPDLRDRHRLLERALSVTLTAAVIAVLVPWIFRATPGNLGRVAFAACVYALAVRALGAWVQKTMDARKLERATAALSLSAPALLAFLWDAAGGLGQPGFLLVFALPIAATAALAGPRLAFGTAAVAALAVWITALHASFDLAWYLRQLGVPGQWLLSAIAPDSPGSGISSDPGAVFALLSAFAVLVPAVAFVGKLVAGPRSPVAAAQQDVDLSRAVLDAHAVPSVLVTATTAQIVHAGPAFCRQMLMEAEDVTGRDLREVLVFEDVLRLGDLLKTGGRLPVSLYHLGPETRLAELRADPVRHGGHRYAHLRIDDHPDLPAMVRAIEADAEPLLLLSPDDILRGANEAARTLAPGLRRGRNAQSPLEAIASRPGWWRECGVDSGLTLAGARHRVRRATLTTADGEHELVLLRLTPRGRRRAPSPAAEAEAERILEDNG